MKRLIAVLLGLALLAGAPFAFARSGGGGHGGGGHGGGSRGGAPGAGGGYGGGPMHFTTGPMHFTTGPIHFTGGHPGGPPRPILPPRPIHPIVHPPGVIVGHPPGVHPPHGGTIIVSGGYFWYPPYYPYYPYGYVPPAYGGEPYVQPPTYIEQGEIRYYCPDYQDYYPNVPNCPSPWMQVIPDTGGYSTN